jgi:hypothetical protein
VIQPSQWLAELPSFVLVLIGIGAIAIALNAILALWKAVRPVGLDQAISNVASLKEEMIVVRERLELAERALARIDTEAISNRFDRMEKKIDELTAILLKTFAGR